MKKGLWMLLCVISTAALLVSCAGDPASRSQAVSSGSDVGTKTETGTNTETGTRTETETKTEAETRTENGTGAEPVTEVENGEETPTDADSETVSQISIVSLCIQDTFVKGLAAEFDKENPAYAVSYENLYNSKDRVLAEVMNGSGPDILCLDMMDMINLQEKDALAEMEPFLTKDILENVFSTALELGTLDGKLYGLPAKVLINTLMVSRKVYDGDTWSMADVLETMKAHPEIKWMFKEATGSWWYDLKFLLGDLEHSSFLQDGKAHFDCPEFKELLSLTRERSNASDKRSGNPTDLLRDGDYLGVDVTLLSLNTYGNYLDLGLGEEFSFIGYPSETQSTGYMMPMFGMVAVNQASMDKPGIGELLQYLYSLEKQKTLQLDATCIRRDVLESKVVYNEYTDCYIYDEGGSRGWVLLPGKGKDDFYLEDYLEFVDSTVPYPYPLYYGLMDIIWEDAEDYFESDKNLDDVVESIERRISLYLSENQ